MLSENEQIRVLDFAVLNDFFVSDNCITKPNVNIVVRISLRIYPPQIYKISLFLKCLNIYLKLYVPLVSRKLIQTKIKDNGVICKIMHSNCKEENC